MTTLAKPTPIGALYANLGVNTSVVQVVAPGNNLHGLVIRTLYVNSYAGTIGVQVYADTAAPSAYGDGTKRLIFIRHSHSDDQRAVLFVCAAWPGDLGCCQWKRQRQHDL